MYQKLKRTCTAIVLLILTFCLAALPSCDFLKLPVVLQRTAKKCTKNYNARAQPLFCSLNLLFGDVAVAVAVAVVVFLSSLIFTEYHMFTHAEIQYGRHATSLKFWLK